MDHQMPKRLQDILKTCKVKLQENLTVTPDFWTTLSGDAIFTKQMVDMFKVGRHDDVSWMLDELPKRGPEAFTKFIQVLNKTGHQYLANMLNMLQFEASIIKAPATPEPKPPLRAVQSSGCVGESPVILTAQDHTEKIEEAFTSLNKAHCKLRSKMFALRKEFEEIQERKNELAEVGPEQKWRTVSEGMRIKGKSPKQILQERARLQDELMSMINEHQQSLSLFCHGTKPEDVMNTATRQTSPRWHDDVDAGSVLSCEPLSLNTEVFWDPPSLGRCGQSDNIGMLDQHREILRSQKTYLLENITATEVFWSELSQNIFTKNMIESFQAAPIPNQQVGRMLDELPKRGPTAFSDFIEVLGTSGHGFVADTLRNKRSSTSLV